MDPREAARLLRQYVQTALAERASGGGGQAYEQLVRQFNNINKNMQGADRLAEEHALNLLKALTCCVSLLTRKHDDLLRSLFSVRLWACAPEVRAQLLDLLINLVVANAVFAHSCFNHLVTNLLPPPAPPAPDLEAGGPWTAKQNDVDAQDAVIHALEKTMSLVPTAHSTLEPMLLSAMPHKLRDRNTHCLYLRAVLRLCEGPNGALLTPPLLRGVVEHLLALDVEIRWEDIVDNPNVDVTEEEAPEEEEEDVFELEAMAQDLQLGGGAHGGAHHAPEERGGWEGARAAGDGEQGAAGEARPPVDEAADKLDSMMELVFEHLQRRCQRGEVLAVWQAVIHGFESTLLRTPRSKFTQYLLFFLCRQSPSHCCASFLATLTRLLRDPLQPPTTRAAAAAYLASFLARAAFVPPALLVSTLKDLTAICRDYTRSPSSHNLLLHDFAPSPTPSDPPTTTPPGLSSPLLAPTGPPSALPPHLAKHQVFYAMVQALLYVLCYHLRPLLHPPAPSSPTRRRRAAPAPPHADAVRDLITASVHPILAHPLRPLDVCLPSVSHEFAHQAASLRLADIHSLLPPADTPSRAHRPLEMFFPFDPYLLRRSSRLLALPASYITWRRGHAHYSAPPGVDPSAAPNRKRRPRGAAPADDEDDNLSTSSAGPSEDDADEDLGLVGGSEDGNEDDDDDTNASVDGESSDSSDDDDVRSASTRSGSLQPGSLPGSLPFGGGSVGLLRPRPVGQRGGGGGRGGGGDLGRSFSPGAMAMGAEYGVYGGSPFGTSPPVAMSITPDIGFFAAAMAARGGKA